MKLLKLAGVLVTAKKYTRHRLGLPEGRTGPQNATPGIRTLVDRLIHGDPKDFAKHTSSITKFKR